MNDVGYLKLPFEGSELQKSILYSSFNDIEDLKYHRGYIEGAVEFHTEEQNPYQVSFFQQGLDLMNKKIRKLEKNI